MGNAIVSAINLQATDTHAVHKITEKFHQWNQKSLIQLRYGSSVISGISNKQRALFIMDLEDISALVKEKHVFLI